MFGRFRLNYCNLEETPGFWDELNRQCSFLLIPGTLAAIFFWLPFIQADRNLFPQYPLFVYLRLGFAAVGAAVLLMRFISRWRWSRRLDYWLVVLIFSYASLSAAVMVGMTHGRPVYMSGLLILFIVMPVSPFRRRHSYILLFSSLVVAAVSGIFSGYSFSNWDHRYGLYNLMVALAISFTAIFSLDCIRKRSYEKGRLLRESNRELEKIGMALRVSNERLKKANEVKSDLLNLAAHDLKNPLQVIIAHAGLLKLKFPDNGALAEKLDLINHSADNMVRLINEILKTSSIDNGTLNMKKMVLDLNDVAASVAVEQRVLADLKAQEIFFRAGDSCLVMGDPVFIREILDNLLGNAVKFSPLGARIKMETERVGDDVFVHFHDQGPGLTEEDKKRLFGRFQRLSARPTAGEASTGLGLSIARDLAELQGGVILVKSEAGRGSVFSLRLPGCEKITANNPEEKG